MKSGYEKDVDAPVEDMSHIAHVHYKVSVNEVTLIYPVHICGIDKTSKRERLCTVCNSGEIEDEEHFLLNCNAYTSIRHVFLT